MSTIVKRQSSAPGQTKHRPRMGSVCAQMGESVFAAGARNSGREMAGNQGKNLVSIKVTHRHSPANHDPHRRPSLKRAEIIPQKERRCLASASQPRTWRWPSLRNTCCKSTQPIWHHGGERRETHGLWSRQQA